MQNVRHMKANSDLKAAAKDTSRQKTLGIGGTTVIFTGALFC